MKRFFCGFLAFAVILVCAIQAPARLGDTCGLNYLHYGAVIKRYQDSTNQWHAPYATTNYLIIVYYQDNVSECEIFYPVAGKFAPEERETLMKKIGNGASGWSRMADSDWGREVWTNSATVAILDDEPSRPHFLVIATRDFISQEGAKVISEANQKTAGF